MCGTCSCDRCTASLSHRPQLLTIESTLFAAQSCKGEVEKELNHGNLHCRNVLSLFRVCLVSLVNNAQQRVTIEELGVDHL